jgi:hypothetical protein
MTSDQLRTLQATVNEIGAQAGRIENLLKQQAVLHQFILGTLERSCPALVPPESQRAEVEKFFGLPAKQRRGASPAGKRR